MPARGYHGVRRLLVLLLPSVKPTNITPIWIPGQTRWASSGTRWKQRQGRDPYAREAKVHGLKSRAAFKLLEMDAKYKFFRPGQTVVDLGFAPGSWSQVAVERTRPNSLVVGIDLLPAQPPRGVSAFQGDFLSPDVQNMVRDFIIGRVLQRELSAPSSTPAYKNGDEATAATRADLDRPSYLDMERRISESAATAPQTTVSESSTNRLIDIVLSDMSEPWEQTSGFNLNSLSNPFRRLMNTSGNTFRDHAGSMDLCSAALHFASDTLKPGGHFICKFYQGAEDKALEEKLKRLFAKVYREKPESSRSESKEAYFVGLRRRADVVIVEDG